MKTTQYTIRNLPEPVDRYLRKRARMTGQSLNQTVVRELSERAGLSSVDLVDSLSWFIGNNTIGKDALRAMDEEDKKQKELTQKEW